jgi:sigma-B regulation protein RsbU (phosphoserine phosphatase)
MKKSKLSRRITWRVIGIMMFFNVLIIGAILAFVYVVSLGNSTMRGQYVTDGISRNIETMLQTVKTAAFNSRINVEASMDSPEHIFETLEQILQVNRGLSGCFVALEPDFFKGQGQWFEAYAYYADSTHIEHQQIGSPQHDYFNGVWYQKGLSTERNGDGYLTDMYYDDTVNSGMFFSYVIPISDRQGRKVGVYGADLNVKWLDMAIQETMESVKMEFLDDDESIEDLDKIYFSIQIIDGNGKRVTGTDSLDLSLLKAEQEEVFGQLEMKNLKGTPYFINSRRLGSTGWTLAVLQHQETVFAWGYMLALAILLVMTLGCVVIFFFTRRSIRRTTKPLGFLSESTLEVSKGNFDAPLPTFKYNDEVAQLRDSFGVMQQSLKQYVEELKVSTAAKASIESELNVAHGIQMSMLPKTFPAFSDYKNIELYASLKPAKAVGGDLYDFFIHDEKLFFCIGDVSGKGVPASLVMAVSLTLFRNISAHTAEPKHIVETMNVNICKGNDDCMFVTLFVGVLDLATGRLRYCNAGHEAPYVQAQQLPCNSNFPIGIMSDFEYLEQETMIAPGMTFFLYTDGLNEAMNADNVQFGDNRILDEMNHVMQDSQLSPKAVIDHMSQAVYNFVGDTEQSDDLTMLAFKYKN